MADKLDSRPVLVANIETLRGADFLVLVLFGADGYKVAARIKPFEGRRQITKEARALLDEYHVHYAEAWTYQATIWHALRDAEGIYPMFKHPLDVSCTSREVMDVEEALIDVYGLDERLPDAPRVLPKWKTVIIGVLTRIIQKLEGGNN